MEFLSQNILDTTTMVVASTGSGTFGYLFNRNDSLAYSTIGYTTNTSTIISIEFPGTVVISNLILKNVNLRQFRAFYNSATANTFSVDVNVSSNSATSMYFSFNSITVSSVQLQLDLATSVDTERRVGEFIISERTLQFPVNPSAKNYDPAVNRTKIVHRMPDGGVSVFNIRNKFKATVDLEYITEAFHSSLSDVYNDAEPQYFLPYPTTTGWDGRAYEVNWTNQFDFKYEDNAKSQGLSGKMVLEETPGA